MPEYNRGVNPPAPYASVEIRRRSSSQSITGVPMLLDTGADVTLVPRVAVEFFGLTVTPLEAVNLVGFDGSAKPATVAEMELHLEENVFRGSFHIIEDSYGIIGRDILNLLKMVFDGPNLRWEVV